MSNTGATDRPLISLKVGKEGSELRAVDFGDRLISLSYEDDEKKADKLTLNLDNQDFRFLDEDIFKKGNTLLASFGYAGNMQTVECVVNRISGSLEGHFQVEAEHKGFQLHKNKKSAIFPNATRSEVAQQLATRNGFTSGQTFIQDTRVRHEFISQPAMTDAELLKRMADAVGFLFYVNATGFHFHKRDWDQAPSKTVTWFVDGSGDIQDGTHESDHKKRKGRVQSESRDPMGKTTTKTDSKNGTVPRTSLGPVLEQTALAEAVSGATGETSYQARVANDDVRPSTEASPAAAKAQSDAGFEKQQQSTFKLRLTLVGDPKLHAKQILQVLGIGKRYSGLWYISKCRHSVEGAFLTHVECIRDAHHGHKGTSKDAKTDGAVNNKEVDSGPRTVEDVNGRTGETSYSFRTK